MNMIVLIFIVICANFFIFRIPMFLFGISPVELMISPSMLHEVTPEYIDALYLQFGLVRNPDVFDWIYMFWRYLINMFTGNFGISFVSYKTVSDEILSRLPNTLILMGTSLIISIIIGVKSGKNAVSKANTKKDSVYNTISSIVYSLPSFWIGLVLIILFGLFIPSITNNIILLPMGGTIDYDVWSSSQGNVFQPLILFVDYVRHLILPCITLGISNYATYFFYTRNTLLSVLNEDYILTARAIGASEDKILSKHAMKNVMIPIMTIIGMSIGFLLGGSIIIEKVFNWQGLGLYMFNSLLTFDYPVVQALFMIITVSVVVANFIVDILYAYIDPRIKY